MACKYIRSVSITERLWILMDKIYPPYANQMVLEGDGDFNFREWEKAVREASEANPGSRVKYKGFTKYSKWVDSGISPKVKIVDGSSWSGMCNENADFLKKPLSIKNGSPCEVLLVEGNIKRIVFRSSHAVMDGRGTMTWAKDVFRVLRGQEPKGSNCTLTDAQLAQSFQTRVRKPFSSEHLAPTGKAIIGERGVTWKRISLKGKYSKLLPQLILIANSQALNNSNGIVRVAVPVDLRARKEDLRSTCNLTIAIYLDITNSSTLDSIANDIKQQLKIRNDGVLTNGNIVVGNIPICLMQKKAEKILSEQNKKSLYNISGLFSNLGSISDEEYSYKAFRAKTCFFIPPGIEFFPIFTTITGMEDNIEIMVSIPNVLGSHGRLEKMIHAIQTQLIKTEEIHDSYPKMVSNI